MGTFDSKTFNSEAFGRYLQRIPQLKKNELLKSGALVGNPEIRNAFSNQTTTHYATIPLYGLLDGDPVNYDGSTDITSTSTTTYTQSVIVYGRAKAWTERDFSEDITGGVKFMDNVAAQIAEYWDGIHNSVLLSQLKGIFAMTGAKNLEFVNNHTYDISADTTNNVVGATTLNNAIQKAAGDNKKVFTMAIMHSQVATNLENLKLLEYMKYTDANGIERRLDIAQWSDKIVIIDDGMPVETVAATGSGSTATPAYTKYTTYVLGKGAFFYENIGAKVPEEMDRDPKVNGGQDTLYSRERKCLAPYGISYVTSTKISPANSDFETGTNWALIKDAGGTKTINHRAIPIARIISRG